MGHHSVGGTCALDLLAHYFPISLLWCGQCVCSGWRTCRNMFVSPVDSLSVLVSAHTTAETEVRCSHSRTSRWSCMGWWRFCNRFVISQPRRWEEELLYHHVAFCTDSVSCRLGLKVVRITPSTNIKYVNSKGPFVLIMLLYDIY
jgi:hypothetical protein